MPVVEVDGPTAICDGGQHTLSFERMRQKSVCLHSGMQPLTLHVSVLFAFFFSLVQVMLN